MLYDDLSHAYQDGFVFRGSTSAMAAYFHGRNCSILRTGAEAVLDLQKPHMARKTVVASLIRGEKYGFVEEIDLNDETRQRFGKFLLETIHAGKPQLLHLFRHPPYPGCRLFVFREFSGKWLAAITLSSRGYKELHTELMLRHRDAPGGIMECLVSGIFARLKHDGYREWSLGEVPFMMVDNASRLPLGSLEQLMVAMAPYCRHAYDYESLYRFKNKFAPVWRPVMLCASITSSPLILAELAVSMGFIDLVAYQSIRLLRNRLFPA
ncbi:phosphatidylglycerol lysyltransferase domain-containing protein [Chlorobium sp.]|uniref:phosphatidylglycerol lysyltransferase domain-containing protein n=1 Tax=Chlorobium sp. TaxID=1095 RepID=UPI0025C17FC3|nr:phosphatidylglycerol lysyltransferase domain-containing protein [Chlorobium sp.]